MIWVFLMIYNWTFGTPYVPPCFNPKRCGLFGGVLFGEMKFVLSNFLSNEDLIISYES
jgi:hypothetical protein